MTETSGPTLPELTEAYRSATAAAGRARDALVDGIRAEYRAGMRQADIVRAIDHEWSGEYVRQIVKSVASDRAVVADGAT